jgi:hypothetical protein
MRAEKKMRTREWRGEKLTLTHNHSSNSSNSIASSIGLLLMEKPELRDQAAKLLHHLQEKGQIQWINQWSSGNESADSGPKLVTWNDLITTLLQHNEVLQIWQKNQNHLSNFDLDA